MLDDPIHHPDVLGEASAGGLKAGRASDLFVGGALGEGFVPAVVALAAGDVVKDDDTIAGREASHSGTDGRDNARGFVAEDAGRGVGSGGNFLEVSAADAAGMDAKEQFARADRRHRNGFQADVIDSAVDGGEHGRRDGFAAGFDGDLSGDRHQLFECCPLYL